MFIQMPHSDGGFAPQSQLLDDGGSAVAAQIDQFAIVLVLVRRKLGEAGALLQKRTTGQHLLPKQLDGRKFGPEGPRPVGELCASLHRAVVSAHDLAHARRIAAAAHVFQQASVVEVRDDFRIETCGEADTNRQQAGADCVSRNRAFRQIKGE